MTRPKLDIEESRVSEGYEELRADVGEPVPLGLLVEWTGARLMGPTEALREPVRGLALDSRALLPGDLFIALPGERADGHNFLPDVADRAQAALVSRPDTGPAMTQLVVEDVPAALLQIGAGFRSRFPDLVALGVTGSVGKTTTKDYLGAVLSLFGPTVASPGNLNTTYGVPLTLSGLRPDTAWAVLEMGMQWAGEIGAMTRAARPQIGLVTAIGAAHLEFFDDVRGIALAKAELIEGLPAEGVAILPSDSVYLGLLREHAPCPVVTFGASGADCRAENVIKKGFGSRFEVVWNPPSSGVGRLFYEPPNPRRDVEVVPPEGFRFEVELSLPGPGHVKSALRAATAALVLKVPPEVVARGLKEARITPMRGEVVRRGGLTILSDTYNANPESVACALETLSDFDGRKIVVLGDMLELGKDAARFHEEAGAAAAEAISDKTEAVLIAVGRFAQDVLRGAKAHGVREAHAAEDRREAARLLAEILRPGDVLLVKASRAMRLDLLLDELEEPT